MRIHNFDDNIAKEKNESRGLIGWLEGFFVLIFQLEHPFSNVSHAFRVTEKFLSCV